VNVEKRFVNYAMKEGRKQTEDSKTVRREFSSAVSSEVSVDENGFRRQIQAKKYENGLLKLLLPKEAGKQ